MKKLFLMAAALFAAVSFSACSEEDKVDVKTSIIGTWQITHDFGYQIVPGEGRFEYDTAYPIEDKNDEYGFYYTYTFNENGSGRYKSYYYYDPNAQGSDWTFEYTISNNQLSIYYEDDGTTELYNIVEVTKDKLILLYTADERDGYKADLTYTYKRI